MAWRIPLSLINMWPFLPSRLHNLASTLTPNSSIVTSISHILKTLGLLLVCLRASIGRSERLDVDIIHVVRTMALKTAKEQDLAAWVEPGTF